MKGYYVEYKVYRRNGSQEQMRIKRIVPNITEDGPVLFNTYDEALKVLKEQVAKSMENYQYIADMDGIRFHSISGELTLGIWYMEWEHTNGSYECRVMWRIIKCND